MAKKQEIQGVKKHQVGLIAKDTKEPKVQKFEIDQANKLLKLPNSRFELADDEFDWNGIEISKK